MFNGEEVYFSQQMELDDLFVGHEAAAAKRATTRPDTPRPATPSAPEPPCSCGNESECEASEFWKKSPPPKEYYEAMHPKAADSEMERWIEGLIIKGSELSAQEAKAEHTKSSAETSPSKSPLKRKEMSTTGLKLAQEEKRVLSPVFSSEFMKELEVNNPFDATPRWQSMSELYDLDKIYGAKEIVSFEHRPFFIPATLRLMNTLLNAVIAGCVKPDSPWRKNYAISSVDRLLKSSCELSADIVQVFKHAIHQSFIVPKEKYTQFRYKGVEIGALGEHSFDALALILGRNMFCGQDITFTYTQMALRPSPFAVAGVKTCISDHCFGRKPDQGPAFMLDIVKRMQALTELVHPDRKQRAPISTDLVRRSTSMEISFTAESKPDVKQGFEITCLEGSGLWVTRFTANRRCVYTEDGEWKMIQRGAGEQHVKLMGIVQQFMTHSTLDNTTDMKTYQATSVIGNFGTMQIFNGWVRLLNCMKTAFFQNIGRYSKIRGITGIQDLFNQTTKSRTWSTCDVFHDIAANITCAAYSVLFPGAYFIMNNPTVMNQIRACASGKCAFSNKQSTRLNGSDFNGGLMERFWGPRPADQSLVNIILTNVPTLIEIATTREPMDTMVHPGNSDGVFQRLTPGQSMFITPSLHDIIIIDCGSPCFFGSTLFTMRTPSLIEHNLWNIERDRAKSIAYDITEKALYGLHTNCTKYATHKFEEIVPVTSQLSDEEAVRQE
jgi:hypothetical protein